MNKKGYKVIFISGLIVIGLFVVFFQTFRNSFLAKPVVNAEDVSSTALITLEINGVKYESKITGTISVYDFMSKLRNEGKINFTEKNYIGMGEFIDGINGIKNNSNQSWIYYVNNQEASVGISNYKINPGDVVSWKYEKANY